MLFRSDSWFEPMAGVRARLRNAGHILGSTFIEMEVDASPRPLRLTFSGDLGSSAKALQPSPESPAACDVLLLESTYGGRTRIRLTAREREDLLNRELAAGLAAGGNIIVPVFAVERTQEILDDIADLKSRGALGPVTVFLDSPLAGRTTEVFRRHEAALGNDGNRFTPGDFRFTETVEQSKAIDRIHGGAIVLAGSGMCDAGRVKHHLKNHLWRPDSTVLFVGYQAPGTLGATIREGAAQVRIHGEEVRVKARIRAIDAYSGHADRDELVEWVRPVLPTLGSLLAVHGEPQALTGIVNALVEAGLAPERIAVPSLDQAYEFSYRDGRWIAALSNAEAAPRLSVEEVTATRDWHNEYAQTLLDLRSALNRATDNRVRRRLLREVRRVIDEAHR